MLSVRVRQGQGTTSAILVNIAEVPDLVFYLLSTSIDRRVVSKEFLCSIHFDHLSRVYTLSKVSAD